MRKLKLNNDDRLFMGVCGGIAKSMNVDSTLVRVGFIFLTMVFPATPIVYIMLSIFMPYE